MRLKDGSTPLDAARHNGHTAAVAFLESAIASKAATTCCVASDTRECANCSAPQGHNGIVLKPCTRCRLVSYCGTSCQTQHWKKGGHKANCFALNQRSVAALKQESASTREASPHAEKCSICLEPLSNEANRPLGCGHVLHSKCAEALEVAGATRACPVCRRRY